MWFSAMSTMDDFIKWCRDEREALRQQLEPLESGRMHIGRRRAGGPWEDMTPGEIERLKRNIAELDELIARPRG